MTQIKVNGHNQTKGNGHTNGHHAHGTEAHNRAHPQTSFAETSIDPSSFFGKLRKLYFEKVLKTQLEQLKRQGSYDAFKLEWHPAYEVRRLHGGKTRVSVTAYLHCRRERPDDYRLTGFHQACSGSLTSESGESVRYLLGAASGLSSS